jgi:hypothetical protein
MTIPIYDLVDSRTVVRQVITEGATPNGRAFRRFLHHVPNVYDTHCVGREQDEVRRVGSRVQICS